MILDLLTVYFVGIVVTVSNELFHTNIFEDVDSHLMRIGLLALFWPIWTPINIIIIAIEIYEMR
jgi:hypothetical protein